MCMYHRCGPIRRISGFVSERSVLRLQAACGSFEFRGVPASRLGQASRSREGEHAEANRSRYARS